MARRKRKGALDDLFVIAARLPWKVSVGLAVLSFLVLHAISAYEPAAATSTRDVGVIAAKSMARTLASIGQFVLPLICLGGAVAGFFAQRHRAELVTTVAASESATSLTAMSWREFEGLVQEAFRLRGYSVRRIGGEGPDGGVDLVLERDGEKTLVQCKQWRTFKVGVGVVRELYGVMAAKGVASGMVVTAGVFTQDAIEFAAGRNVRLIAGEELHGLIRDARAAAPLPVGMTNAVAGVASTQGCPRCGSPMVKRQAKRGANAGQAFYGCSRFPACRGTLSQ
jgi:restriction system protein